MTSCRLVVALRRRELRSQAADIGGSRGDRRHCRHCCNLKAHWGNLICPWFVLWAWDSKFALGFSEVKRTTDLLLYDDFVLVYDDFGCCEPSIYCCMTIWIGKHRQWTYV